MYESKRTVSLTLYEWENVSLLLISFHILRQNCTNTQSGFESCLLMLFYSKLFGNFKFEYGKKAVLDKSVIKNMRYI